MHRGFYYFFLCALRVRVTNFLAQKQAFYKEVQQTLRLWQQRREA
jgi:hypothetical protein